MRSFRMPRTKRAAATATATTVGLGVVAALALVTAPTASSHGYTDTPISRQKLCANKTVSDCGPIQWEPQSVEGLKGFPAAGPADGRICAGNHPEFAQLDDPRGGAWPATPVTSGQSYSFRWQFTANHSTTDFRYYVTKNGWDSTKPLTRAALDPQPFLTVAYNGTRPAMTTVHQGTMPSGKTGRHMILAVWTVNDTAMAFYSCSDVQF
ncbi:lytic polysaccharide monooxygenase auxiliary activity family 9 protein [Streptomyces sp. NBC_01264]|uniref:lytic polysaccharide monooxygenase auxiliary activity family 9 protein n=1 Tax=Streptomyces sp. NBC_01264 TaxID=2903804 RepID=UPI00225383E0|nr:lytic polysaccharide monooxygenase [Streptomyces sp. NBC_01264]MCX4778605.1 lytic polysaccharide monooxygenase [Streptomyces sp. NBC_01264]